LAGYVKWSVGWWWKKITLSGVWNVFTDFSGGRRDHFCPSGSFLFEEKKEKGKREGNHYF
jgi:hypothetical protein